MEEVRLDKISKELFEKREQIVFRCLGCDKLEKKENTLDNYCTVFAFPQYKWTMSDCPGATHIKKETTDKQKTRVGQQKQKKRK